MIKLECFPIKIHCVSAQLSAPSNAEIASISHTRKKDWPFVPFLIHFIQTPE